MSFMMSYDSFDTIKDENSLEIELILKKFSECYTKFDEEKSEKKTENK